MQGAPSTFQITVQQEDVELGRVQDKTQFRSKCKVKCGERLSALVIPIFQWR